MARRPPGPLATRQYTNVSGPRYTSIQLDGADVSGTDGGDIACRAGAPELAYDETSTNDSHL